MDTQKVLIHPAELNGDVYITGAKNAALRHLAASILTDGSITLDNYPVNMLDVKLHEDMIKYLGKTIKHNRGSAIIEGKIQISELIWDKRSIRNTLLILGALLTKAGCGKVPLPGGCDLGDRKYDIHVELMRNMGAQVWQEGKYLCANVESRLHGCEYTFPIRSTGATENAVIMGSLAEGITKIWNPHIRPEILDLIALLRKLGAKIKVNGQESIEIEGVDSLEGGISHFIVGDSLQAFTYLVAGAMAGKELLIHNFPFDDLEVPLIYMKFSGMSYFRNENNLIVRKCRTYPIEISTGSYPGVNSDLQPFFAVWGALSNGISAITDLRYVGRYGYADEFAKMGVCSEIDNTRLLIHGGRMIKGGTTVRALDLRAGAACVLLALIADAPTQIEDFWMVERGYDDIIAVLRSVGVKIEVLK